MVTQKEIAAQLQISDTTTYRDMTLLGQQAKEHIKKYIYEKLPFEYQKTLAGLQGIIKSIR
jgi:hypothetical protein